MCYRFTLPALGSVSWRKSRRGQRVISYTGQNKTSGQERVTEGVGWGAHGENRLRLMHGEWMREY